MPNRFFLMIRQAAALLVLSAILAAGANLVHPRKLPWIARTDERVAAKAQAVTQAGFKVTPLVEALEGHRTGTLVLVDAREQAIFRKQTIPGALNVSLDPSATEDIFTQTDRLPKDKPLVIFCDDAGCPKSLTLAKELKQFGFTDLRVLVEGIKGWQELNGPLGPGDAKAGGGK